MAAKPLPKPVLHILESVPHAPPAPPTAAQLESAIDTHLGLTTTASSLTLAQFLALFPTHGGTLPAGVTAALTTAFDHLAALTPSATLLTQSDIVAAVTGADANHDGSLTFAELAKAPVHLVGIGPLLPHLMHG